MKKRCWIVAYLVLALAMLFTGCAGAPSMKQSLAYDTAAAAPAEPAAAPAPEAFYEAEYMDYAAAEEGYYGSVSGGSGVPNTVQTEAQENGSPDFGGRKVIRTLGLELRTDNFDEHLACIKKDTQTAGGYVENAYVYGTKPQVAGDSGRNANLTLRIPEGQVDAFVSAASGYGTLLSQSEDTQDVTDSYFDLETRLEVNRVTLERLKSILVQTDNLADVIALEQEIARVTIEIEELTTRLRKYDGLISFATVNISLYEEGMKIGPAAASTFSERVSEGFAENMSALGNFLEDFAVLLLSSLPVLVPLALIVILSIYLYRRRIQKEAEAGLPLDAAGWQRRAWRRQQRLGRKNPPPAAVTKEDKGEKS